MGRSQTGRAGLAERWLQEHAKQEPRLLYAGRDSGCLLMDIRTYVLTYLLSFKQLHRRYYTILGSTYTDGTIQH